MCPPVEPDARLDVVRRQDLELLDAVAHVRRVLGDRIEHELARGGGVGAVRRVLREHAQHVLPGRRDRRVVGRVDVQLAEADGRGAGAAGVGRGLHPVDPGGDRDHRPLRALALGRGGPRRQAAQERVELHDRRVGPPRRDAVGERGRRIGQTSPAGASGPRWRRRRAPGSARPTRARRPRRAGPTRPARPRRAPRPPPSPPRPARRTRVPSRPPRSPMRRRRLRPRPSSA